MLRCRAATTVVLLAAAAIALCAGASAAPAKVRAPKAVPAWYMTAASTSDLVRQAKHSACVFARRQPGGSRLMLFDFGGARKYADGTFGANLRGLRRFRNGAILQALKGAARQYAHCHRRGSAVIAYGTTNTLPGNMSTLDAHEAGVHQALTVKQLRRFQHQQHNYVDEGAAAAGDIEPGFGYPEVTKALVSGANSTTYYDFGNAGGCPGQPGASGCYNEWDLGDLGEVSAGGHSLALPEIYRGYEATQWARIQRHWGGGYVFAGVTGAPNEHLSPAEGWKRLRNRADRVRRELVSIRESGVRFRPATGPSGSGRPVGGPMTTTTPAHLVQRPEGFFSTSLIYPLANEWVAADDRRFVAVDAGADPLDPSTGVLGIFRQNYLRVSQRQRVIKVPDTGALELTGAPSGAARAALARPSTRLRFRGANGQAGTLDLADGSVTLDGSTGGAR
jgi:hypothetical protein